ncbi:MAG: response regulator [Anaerolineales bacterium]|jgi:DNA-binding response OmpR family regulator|nr:MAG: response regulator [Anaerolineales bacterium]
MDTTKGYLLVVEDIPDILALLETTLKFKGYRVETAVNGQDAIELIEKEAPTLVITDILMPRMDGFSLVHRLRIEPKTRDIPVIFLSATYVAPEDKAFALDIGATRFMEKPVVIEDFLALIEDLLKAPKPESVKPVTEKEFYLGYRQRLEFKLAEKNMQIARAESLVQNVNEVERDHFTGSLHHTVNERKELLRLLDQVNAHLERLEEA